jgi:dynein heavy chain 1
LYLYSHQVGLEFTSRLDLDSNAYLAPNDLPVAVPSLPMPPTHRQAVMNAFVHVHEAVRSEARRVAHTRQRRLVVTPRHYLDFIEQYVRLYGEKKGGLEEQQLHVTVGLSKLHETVAQVGEMGAILAGKQAELQQAQDKAEAKLQEMVRDQQAAEQKRALSLTMREELRVKEQEVAQRKAQVVAELSDVEPAVQDAAAAVKDIKKQQLVEVRALANPPLPVKMALESICVLLGGVLCCVPGDRPVTAHGGKRWMGWVGLMDSVVWCAEPSEDWKAIRSVIIRDDFIASIVNYTTDQLTPAALRKVQAEYLAKPEFTFEAVNRASKACGPLVKWVIAQINYATMLTKIAPLRAELAALEQSVCYVTLRYVTGCSTLGVYVWSLAMAHVQPNRPGPAGDDDASAGRGERRADWGAGGIDRAVQRRVCEPDQRRAADQDGHGSRRGQGHPQPRPPDVPGPRAAPLGQGKRFVCRPDGDRRRGRPARRGVHRIRRVL